jgi:hypothetical protein
MQTDGDHPSGGPAPEIRSPSEDAYEIVTRVADAMAVLADAMTAHAGQLAGASIAKSIHGTLLLNGPAWELFGALLVRELPGLGVLHPARPTSQPLRFVLLARSLQSSHDS